jgi:hypothetical protein
MNSFFRKLHWLTKRRSKEVELREELQFHLEEEAEQRQASLRSGVAGRAELARQNHSTGLRHEEYERQHV